MIIDNAKQRFPWPALPTTFPPPATVFLLRSPSPLPPPPAPLRPPCRTTNSHTVVLSEQSPLLLFFVLPIAILKQPCRLIVVVITEQGLVFCVRGYAGPAATTAAQLLLVVLKQGTLFSLCSPVPHCCLPHRPRRVQCLSFLVLLNSALAFDLSEHLLRAQALDLTRYVMLRWCGPSASDWGGPRPFTHAVNLVSCGTAGPLSLPPALLDRTDEQPLRPSCPLRPLQLLSAMPLASPSWNPRPPLPAKPLGPMHGSRGLLADLITIFELHEALRPRPHPRLRPLFCGHAAPLAGRPGLLSAGSLSAWACSACDASRA